MTLTIKSTLSADERLRCEQLVKLLERCGERHESALEEIYVLCSRQLYGVLMRILKIEAIADEALQESFIKIWDNAGDYSPDVASPMTWMYSIARYQALDELRRRRSRENRERPGRESPERVSLIDSAPDTAKPAHEMYEDAELFSRCLDQLPESIRDCIVRAYCEGWSHDELSEAHETPLGTMKSWIRRGLISLRTCIDELA